MNNGVQGTDAAVYFRSSSRAVKKLERAEDKERMMVRFDEEDPSGARVRIRDRDGDSAALLQNEYRLAENRVLRSRLSSRLLLTDPERSTLAVLGKQLGRNRSYSGKPNSG